LFRNKDSAKIKRNLRRKERRRIKKLHAKYNKDIVEKKENIASLENKMETINNNLIIAKALSKKTKTVITSSFKNCKVIATGPSLSRTSKDRKQKLGQLLAGIPRFQDTDIEHYVVVSVLGKERLDSFVL